MRENHIYNKNHKERGVSAYSTKFLCELNGFSFFFKIFFKILLSLIM